MEEATWNLLDKGEKIAQEATVLKEELTATLEQVRKESECAPPGPEQAALLAPRGVSSPGRFVSDLFSRFELMSFLQSSEQLLVAVGAREAHYSAPRLRDHSCFFPLVVLVLQAAFAPGTFLSSPVTVYPQ